MLKFCPIKSGPNVMCGSPLKSVCEIGKKKKNTAKRNKKNKRMIPK